MSSTRKFQRRKAREQGDHWPTLQLAAIRKARAERKKAAKK